MKKLIVIDGLDGSGKETQSNLLEKNLLKRGFKVKKISFPNYSSRSSELIKMYLEGRISKDPSQVNPYAAACFYACDRYISYKTDWASISDDTFVVADRYVSSNAIHQMSKLEKNLWEPFLEWLYDFEYNKLNLPKEDYLIYLDMDIKISNKLLKLRYADTNHNKDIHEADVSYLEKCREAAYFVAKRYMWDIVKCYENEVPLSMEEISDVILNKVSRNFL